MDHFDLGRVRVSGLGLWGMVLAHAPLNLRLVGFLHP